MVTNLDFSAYITDRTRDFVGREWVFAEIDRWLADLDAPRFFIITGEPGIGKTAIAAQLTQFSDDTVAPPSNLARLGSGFLSAIHFCSAQRGSWISPDSFSRSLSTQLAARYPSFAHALVPKAQISVSQSADTIQGTMLGVHITNYHAETSETIFNDLVRGPLQVLCNQSDLSVPLTILVDGLDESLNYSGRTNIVRLLAAYWDLPPEVRFVLTSRPVDRALEPFRTLEPFILDADSRENQRDVEAYVDYRFATSIALRDQVGLEAQAKEIRTHLLTRSQGNFLVLSKVLDGIERGEIRTTDLESLPSELQDLYAWFLDRLTLGTMATWRHLYRPLLGVLAVAREPVDLFALSQWTDLTRQQVVDALHDLREFLNSALEGQVRLYHQSMVDFLVSDDAGPYYVDAKEYHRQIAESYRERFVEDGEPWINCDDYGLRHFIDHLLETQQLSDALSTIDPEFRRAKRFRFRTDSDFVDDLELIVDYLERRIDIADLPALIRCSIIRSLVTNLTTSIPPKVLAALVWFGESERAIALASLSPDSEEKVARFLAIAGALNQSGASTETIREILQKALSITNSLTNVAEGTRDSLRAVTTAQAAPLDWDWGQEIIGEIELPHYRTRATITLALQVAHDATTATDLLRGVLPVVTDNWTHITELSTALARVAQHDLGAVEALVDSLEDQRHRDIIYREVARRLLETQHVRLARKVAERIQTTAESNLVRGALAAHLAKEDVEDARDLLDGIPRDKEGAKVLLDLIRDLGPEHAEFARDVANEIEDIPGRCAAWTYTALIFARASKIEDAQTILTALRPLAGQLPAHESLPVALTIDDAIAEVALTDESAARQLIAEWETFEPEGHTAAGVCFALFDRDIELALRLVELIEHPYHKGILPARAIFRFPDDDPCVTEWRELARDMIERVQDRNLQRRLQAYVLASEGVKSAEPILALFEEENDPKPEKPALESMISVGPAGTDSPPREDTKEVDDMLAGLALTAAHRDVDEALVLLKAIRDGRRLGQALVQLARFLKGPSMAVRTDPEADDDLWRTKYSSSNEVSEAIGELAEESVPLAVTLVDAIPSRTEQARAFAAIAVSVRTRDFEQGQLLLERALATAEKMPTAAAKSMAYLELDRLISEEDQEVDLIQKALTSLPAAQPSLAAELTRYIAVHAADKGQEERALDIANMIPVTHTILDTPHKARALLGIAEAAGEHQKPDIGQAVLDAAFDLVKLTDQTWSSLPRLASLWHRYDPSRAEELFGIAWQLAMQRGMYPHMRRQILRPLAFYQSPYDSQAALLAAQNIQDPYEKAEGLLFVVARGDLPNEQSAEVVSEVKALLDADAGDALAKARALIQLIDIDARNPADLGELLQRVVETVRLAPPVEASAQVNLLLDVYGRYHYLGDAERADKIWIEALETGRNDPF